MPAPVHDLAAHLQTSYAPRLVALSVVIATLASYVALDIAGRTAAARGRARGAWLAAGSAAMGVGIWAMHFVGMLAFRLRAPDGSAPLLVAYDAPLLMLSVLVAVGASALARAILGLGATLGMRVVAEGIETEAQWSRLRELGCELGQDFYVAAPQPAKEVEWLLDAELADARSV